MPDDLTDSLNKTLETTITKTTQLAGLGWSKIVEEVVPTVESEKSSIKIVAEEIKRNNIELESATNILAESNELAAIKQQEFYKEFWSKFVKQTGESSKNIDTNKLVNILEDFVAANEKNIDKLTDKKFDFTDIAKSLDIESKLGTQTTKDFIAFVNDNKKFINQSLKTIKQLDNTFEQWGERQLDVFGNEQKETFNSIASLFNKEERDKGLLAWLKNATDSGVSSRDQTENLAQLIDNLPRFATNILLDTVKLPFTNMTTIMSPITSGISNIIENNEESQQFQFGFLKQLDKDKDKQSEESLKIEWPKENTEQKDNPSWLSMINDNFANLFGFGNEHSELLQKTLGIGEEQLEFDFKAHEEKKRDDAIAKKEAQLGAAAQRQLSEKEAEEREAEREAQKSLFERLFGTLKGLFKDEKMPKANNIFAKILLWTAVLVGAFAGFVVGAIAELTKGIAFIGGVIKGILSKSKFGTKILSLFDDAIKFISKIFSPIIKGIKSIGAGFTKIGNFIKPVLDIIRKFIPFLDDLGKALGVGFRVGMRVAKFIPVVGQILWIIESAFFTILRAVQGAFKGFKEGGILGGILGLLKGGLKGLFEGVIGNILDFLKNGVAWILGMFGFEKISGVLKDFSFVDGFGQAIDLLFDGFGLLWKGIKPIVDVIWSISKLVGGVIWKIIKGIWKAFSFVGKILFDIGKFIFKNIWGGLKKLWGVFKDFNGMLDKYLFKTFQGLFDGLTDAWVLVDKGWKWFKNSKIIQIFKDGYDSVQAFFGGLKDAFLDLIGMGDGQGLAKLKEIAGGLKDRAIEASKAMLKKVVPDPRDAAKGFTESPMAWMKGKLIPDAVYKFVWGTTPSEAKETMAKERAIKAAADAEKLDNMATTREQKLIEESTTISTEEFKTRNLELTKETTGADSLQKVSTMIAKSADQRKAELFDMEDVFGNTINEVANVYTVYEALKGERIDPLRQVVETRGVALMKQLEDEVAAKRVTGEIKSIADLNIFLKERIQAINEDEKSLEKLNLKSGAWNPEDEKSSILRSDDAKISGDELQFLISGLSNKAFKTRFNSDNIMIAREEKEFILNTKEIAKKEFLSKRLEEFGKTEKGKKILEKEGKVGLIEEFERDPMLGKSQQQKFEEWWKTEGKSRVETAAVMKITENQLSTDAKQPSEQIIKTLDEKRLTVEKELAEKEEERAKLLKENPASIKAGLMIIPITELKESREEIQNKISFLKEREVAKVTPQAINAPIPFSSIPVAIKQIDGEMKRIIDGSPDLIPKVATSELSKNISPIPRMEVAKSGTGSLPNNNIVTAMNQVVNNQSSSSNMTTSSTTNTTNVYQGGNNGQPAAQPGASETNGGRANFGGNPGYKRP